METRFTEIKVKGRAVKVPSVRIDERNVIVTGRWLRMAAVQDEALVEGTVIADPLGFISRLRAANLTVDLFTFSQKSSKGAPSYQLPFEWDNLAAIRITTFDDWMKNKLSQDTRRNVRKASKSGIEIKAVAFDESIVHGIKRIYDETPTRQGRRFWHYGKDIQTLQQELSTYLDRSEFIGAYLGGVLIGFIKMVYVDEQASILHILSSNEHYDKRPANALIAKAVQICAEKGISQLVYCKYTYGKGDESSLTEFKRRNGFEPILYPRYYVPLTAKGRLVMKLNLHRGIREVLPKSLVAFLLRLRTKYYEFGNRQQATDTAARA